MKLPALSQDQISELLEKCYDAAVNGLPNSKTCDDLASEYLLKYGDVEPAAKKFASTQVAKCTASGVVTSFGGLTTFAVAVPANVASVIYMQLRMIATIARIGGYDPRDDEVQTLAFVCLTGMSVADACKKAGVDIAEKLAVEALKKIPGEVLIKINKAVGFRLVTKFGTKGVVNLGKLVPVVGGAVGGGMDFIGTKVIARKAYKTFILGDLGDDEE